jgi:two-component system OmpR family response regulator
MRILIVEDEPTLRAQLAEGVGAAGYAVDVAENGTDAHYMGDTEPYDAVILDLGLPRMDGITVLRKWRTAGRSMPVLILTARDGWHEKVAGIDAGADDYLTKPFHMEELLARLRALIRRAGGHASSEMVCGPLTLDTRNSRATVAGQALTLTSHEYRVLAYLMHHRDAVVSRSDLVEHIYAQDFDRDSNTVEVFIARLRKKLPPGMIETVRGLGYRLTAQQ